MSEFDVVIVGGGISGLYTAWRLGKSTDQKIAVLEADSRFGGRFQTCMMPGDFPADLGAMRFVPSEHPLLQHLITELQLPVKPLFSEDALSQNIHKDYFKNKHMKGLRDLVELYSVKEDQLPYFAAAEHPIPLKLPPNGSYFQAEVGESGQLAKDFSLAQYLTLSMNQEVIHKGNVSYPTFQTVANFEAIKSRFVQDQMAVSKYWCIQDGMETLIKGLLIEIANLPNVTLAKDSWVNRVEETGCIFTIQTEQPNQTTPAKAKKLILACNARGIELISWISAHNRTTRLQTLLNKTIKVPMIKLFLTYETPWWEEAGLYCGGLNTDLPIALVTAFYSKHQNDKYSTILAAFAFKRIEIFEGLNQPYYKKFANVCGDVPEELVPSQLLVDYVQWQLRAAFGMDTIPEPVCAAVRIWSSSLIDMALAGTRVGVDPYELQWEAMKPFQDADVYITGDTFLPCTKNVIYTGWSEGVLLTTERILTNYFDMAPIMPDLPLYR